MPTALIGSTGFVGGNILAKHPFDDLYHSTNIADIDGKEYDLIVSAGIPAVVWYANQHPEEDWKAIESLLVHLEKVSTKQFVLISSVDVYTDRMGVDEQTPIDADKNLPYGKHRYQVEQWVREKFPTALIVRLPALFGPGIKKNFVYDLLHDNALEFTHKDSVFQYYDLRRLWDDISIALDHKLTLLNIATEPIGAAEMAKAVFGVDFTNVPPDKDPLLYDMQTVHADAFGKTGRYLYSKAESIAALRDFVASENPEKLGSVA